MMSTTGSRAMYERRSVADNWPLSDRHAIEALVNAKRT
jgi:hypothetical protein